MSIEEIKRKIRDVAESVLKQHDAFFVDCQIRNERGARVIQLLVDTDTGITIDQCAKVSRALSAEMDTHPVFETSFHLEVSSPGIDRPLMLLRQYHKNVGRKFKVKYSTGTEPQTVAATLVSVVEDQLTFRTEKGERVSLSFDHIIESKEELPW